ncbi:MAG: hypothetical protein U1E20_05295 [Methylocystis sp.]|uniref:hypothetical protein n=1 Tax=Methylocystis sp. TaxID=1911079 RepID=UPI003941647F
MGRHPRRRSAPATTRATRASRTIKIAGIWSAALILGVAIAFAVRPTLRHAVAALLNDPATLPALDGVANVHYEPRALACAEAVAALAPQAIERVEAAHGRPFAQKPVIGVYASYEHYARANGLGDPGVAAVTRAGAALLSPTLCDKESDRLEGVVTHELSHVHLSGWRPFGAPRPPQWFTEGLAVMASNGGGAEGVSDDEAAQAIRDGYRIVLDGRRWIDFAALGFEREPPRDPTKSALTQRQRLAYRQAGMFISWLRRRDEAAFLHLLRALEAGEAFDLSLESAFGESAPSLWRRFVSALSQPSGAG